MKEEIKYGTCVKCKCNATQKELEENSECGSYGFRTICDSCASRIDEEMDSDRQK